MAKFPVAIACTLIAASVCGQGSVNFANSATSLIMYQGVGVPVGQYTVALLYSATDPLGDVNSMSPLATTGILPVPGRFLGGVVTTPDTTPYLGTAWFAV